MFRLLVKHKHKLYIFQVFDHFGDKIHVLNFDKIEYIILI